VVDVDAGDREVVVVGRRTVAARPLVPEHPATATSTSTASSPVARRAVRAGVRSTRVGMARPYARAPAAARSWTGAGVQPRFRCPAGCSDDVVAGVGRKPDPRRRHL
jgi:hypothetical protein